MSLVNNILGTFYVSQELYWFATARPYISVRWTFYPFHISSPIFPWLHTDYHIYMGRHGITNFKHAFWKFNYLLFEFHFGMTWVPYIKLNQDLQNMLFLNCPFYVRLFCLHKLKLEMGNIESFSDFMPWCQTIYLHSENN